MAARSHADRSWSASTSGRPSVSVRVARRALLSNSNASSPRTSGSSGIRASSIRVRCSARSIRSARIRSVPDGAVCPVVYSRWMALNTASNRSGSSLATGTR